MNKTVSVIIPAYNVARYLDRCLESVLCQSFSEFEVILIDDGSVDETASVCRKWAEKDKKIRFCSKKNEGQGPTRDQGIDMAEGTYLFFLDADDWIVPDCLELLVKTAEKTRADVVIFDYYLTKRTESGGFTHQPGPRQLCLKETGVTLKEHPELLSRCGGTVWNKFQRKDFIRKNNIRHPDHQYEDISYVYQMLTHAQKIVHLPKLLYYYWINRPESITNKKPYISECLMALDEMKEIIKHYPYRESCFVHLMKYSAAYLQIPLQRVEKHRVKDIENIWAEYYRRYPAAEQIDRLKFILAGDGASEEVFRRLRFLNTVYEYRSLSEVLRSGKNMYDAFSGTGADCFLVDLEGLEAAARENGISLVESCGQLAEAAGEVWKHGDGVFLLETGRSWTGQYILNRLPGALLLTGPQSSYGNYNKADRLREILLGKFVPDMTEYAGEAAWEEKT